MFSETLSVLEGKEKVLTKVVGQVEKDFKKDLDPMLLQFYPVVCFVFFLRNLDSTVKGFLSTSLTLTLVFITFFT